MSRILIKNPLLIATMDDDRRELTGGHILIENGVIISIGLEILDIPADETIDASGMVVLPGLVNTHHHFYQTLTRNIPLMQNQSLFGWLTNYYEVWRELTAEAVTVSTKTALLELMKSGCSTSSDHLYLFPARETGELIDAQITVARDVGARFHATRGSMSLGKSNGGLPPDDTVQTEAEIQADTERLLKLYHDDGEGAMIRLALAPCSPFSVTPELMRSTVGYARVNNLHIHTHLAETLDEDKFCLNMFGKRPADYVDSLGWITDFAWFAHAIHVNDDEIKRLGDAGVGISHCPSSNMRLGSGIARIREMLNAGVKVSLGVDGSASNDGSNLLLEARQALLISRLREEDYWLTARDVLEIATRGGAAALGRNDIGQLTVGKRADLALFSVAGLEYAGAQSDPLAALIFTVRQSPVDYLLVNGEIRIRKGKSRVDEQKLVQTHNWIAQQMLEQAGRKTGIDFMKNEGKE